jgi:hypothetical protein
MAIIQPKSQNSNIRHDGILSIGNFMLMINNHFARFQLPGNLLKTKKMCSLFSLQHAISYLFIDKFETSLDVCQFDASIFNIAALRYSVLYLPHMEYEGSIGLVMR